MQVFEVLNKNPKLRYCIIDSTKNKDVKECAQFGYKQADGKEEPKKFGDLILMSCPVEAYIKRVLR